MNRIQRLIPPRSASPWLAFLLLASASAWAGDASRNAELARQFYEQVWFSNQPEAVDRLVAPEYLLHDIGELKAVREPAQAQKDVAGFFWEHGQMGGSIDFQIAQDDLVATRWQWEFAPRTWWMRVLMLGGREQVPVINVFRFRDGRIVEIWNHRHDIDIGFRTNVLLAKGFFSGLLAALAVFVVLELRRRIRGRGKGMAR